MTNPPRVTPETNATETLQFIDNYVPTLAPGDYTITVTQTATGEAAKPEHTLDKTFAQSQIFTVTGPRFTLPAADVHQLYPPANSQGHFARDLPHIVFNQRMIPWERNIWGPGEQTTPWLALLVFDRSEILAPRVGTQQANGAPDVNPTGTTTITVHDLLNPPPSEANTALPRITDLAQEHIEPEQVLCQVLDIAPETFARVMPAKTDLPYFAHCRKVKILAKADNPQLHPDRDEEDRTLAWYAVLIAARFPAQPPPGSAPRTNVVHLVSLEGYTEYFRHPSPTYWQGKDRIRLVSLLSWAFTCESDAEGSLFASIMHGLVTPPSGLRSSATADDLMLRLPLPEPPMTPEETLAYSMLKAGYTAMSYQTRQGEKTYGWCRGVCTPILPKPLPDDRPLPFLRASQAMIYDPTYGVFDQSYGVAFETGRLLALSSSSFSINLLNWRRQVHRVIDVLAERTAQDQHMRGVLSTAVGQDNVIGLLEHNLVTKTFLTHLTTTFATEVAPSLHSENAAPPDVTPILPQPGDGRNPTWQALQKIFDQQDMTSLLAAIDDQVLPPIVQWLARLYLLYDVPFTNLVADPRMLPTESIRFFYVDRTWLEVLLEGALSIGIHNSKDVLFIKLIKDIILTGVYDTIHTLRDMMLNLPTVTPNDPGSGAFAGMLLRSALVRDWSGLEIHAYGDSTIDPQFATDDAVIAQTAAQPMKLLRLSKLSDDVLLCLFPAVPAWVEIDQPKEALHFGMQTGADKHWVMYPRYVRGEHTGELIQGEDTAIVLTIDATRRLQLDTGNPNGLLQHIQNRLKQYGQQLASGSSAQFAMQMIFAPQSMVFQNTAFPEHP